jgi:hypothetical protein
MSENRVLRRMFGPQRDEVTEDWRKLHSEELHNLYSPHKQNDQVKEDETGRESSFHQFLHNHHHLSSGQGTIGQ